MLINYWDWILLDNVKIFLNIQSYSFSESIDKNNIRKYYIVHQLLKKVYEIDTYTLINFLIIAFKSTTEETIKEIELYLETNPESLIFEKSKESKKLSLHKRDVDNEIEYCNKCVWYEEDNDNKGCTHPILYQNGSYKPIKELEYLIEDCLKNPNNCVLCEKKVAKK